MLDLIRVIVAHGGVVLWLILLTSVAGLTVVIERLWRLLPLRAAFAADRQRGHELLLRGGPAAAGAGLRAGSALGRTMAAGLEVAELGPEAARAAALDAAQREIPALERGLGVVLAVTQVAPLLGLLGTVVGLIESFQVAAQADSLSPKSVAGGVYQALGTTVTGLAVAIPAFLAYVGLAGLVGRLVQQLEHAATDLPALLRGIRR